MTVHAFTRPKADPLAGLTRKQLWLDCIKVSDLPASARSILRTIGQYLDKDGQGSSMSQAQIAAETGLSGITVKRHMKALRDRWLHVEVQKGHMTRWGRENLHHAMIPPSVLDTLRAQAEKRQAARARKPAAAKPRFTVIDGDAALTDWEG